MDSRACRFPFSSPGSASFSSAPLSSGRLHSRSHVLGSDGYTRGTSNKLDSDLQSSRFSSSSSRDYSVSDSRQSAWKLSSPLSATSCDRSWSNSPLGSRSKLGGSERLGAYSGLLSGTQDSDFKRAKLAYSNRTSYSREPASALNSSYSTLEPSWKSHSSRSRSSSSSSSEAVWTRRDPNSHAKPGLSGLVEPVRRTAGLSSSFYPQHGMSSYAQGARPKESFYSSQSSTASRHQRPSRYEPSPLTRDPCRPGTPWAGLSLSQQAERAEGSRTPRGQACEDGQPGEGRRATRQLLSRLASMSSTLFSRRPSQDSSRSSSASRSFESSEEMSDSARADSSPASVASSRSSSPETPQGLAFLRRRRQVLSQVTRDPQDTGAAPETPRPGFSWLSSSLRSRCTPLFSSCSRRESQDEAQPLYQSSPFTPRRRSSQEASATEKEEGAGGGRADEEEGVGAVGPLGSSRTPRGGSVRGAGRVAPDSLFHVSVSQSLDGSLPNHVTITLDIMAAGRSTPEDEKLASSRDPEKLEKIKESLLLEESDEEGDLCRICQMGEDSPSNPLIEPCRCTGSLRFVHQDCMKTWLHSKISSGSDLDTITTCELCKEKLHLNIKNFDINELYRSHERSETEFISCGLYLVVLLHLCEQGFSDVLGAANDAGFFNMARRLHEYMDDLESSNGDSEDEAPDHRPSIDFDDLEDEDS